MVRIQRGGRARVPLHVALVAGTLLAPAEGRQSDDYDWFPRGWYVGASGGLALTATGEGDVEDDLEAFGHSMADVSFDGAEAGWKLFGGYRFDQPFAIELGYVDLGKLRSSASADFADLDDFLADVSRVHPFHGSGFSLAAVAYPFEVEPVRAMIEVGAWRWEADVVVEAATGEKVRVDEDGIDPFLGAGLLWDVGRDVSVRAAYERYWLDDDAVDLFTLGLQMQLN